MTDRVRWWLTRTWIWWQGQSFPNYDSKLAGNLNNILGTNKELEDEDSDSGMKGLIQELDKDEEIGEKINKDLANIANKV